jgi:PAS domain S-box-containing protein
VVLSDYRMPRFSGLAALELLRATGLDLPFIIVSGTIGEEIAVAAMKAGVDDYLTKGELAHLTVAVERELRNAVTRRKHREATVEVQKGEARLAIALEASRSGVWDLDLRDNTAYHTLTHDRIFGYETIQPGWGIRKFLEHVIQGDRPLVEQILHKAVATRSDISTECRIRRADGVVRWILYIGAFRKDAEAKTERIVGIVRDITERKRAEEALRNQAAELRAHNQTLTRFNGVAVGRELRMIELKREVNELCGKLGEPPRHQVSRTEATPIAKLQTKV